MTTGTIVALAVAGLLLIFCEIFVPGGLLGGLGAILLLIGIIAAFDQSPDLGFGLLVGAFACGLIGLWAWLKYLPKSRIGKNLILGDTAEDWDGFDRAKQELVGKQGVAHTTLRPAGTALIDKKRIDVVTQGEMIAANTAVRVIKVEGNRVIVTEA